MWGALPDGLHPWLHAKPLDAAIGWVPAPYCPGSCHGRRFWMKQKNTNKTQLLPSFLTVDQRKKVEQFWDPKQTLYSRHWCDKLCTKVKHHYLSWRAQLHFEISNVVHEQKFEKLLTLNKAQKNLWAIYGPIAVKLLISASSVLSVQSYNITSFFGRSPSWLMRYANNLNLYSSDSFVLPECKHVLAHIAILPWLTCNLFISFLFISWLGKYCNQKGQLPQLLIAAFYLVDFPKHWLYSRSEVFHNDHQSAPMN